MVHRMKTLPIAALSLAAVIAGAPIGAACAQARQAAPSGPTITKAGQALRDVTEINRNYSEKLAKASDPAGKQQVIAAARRKAATAIRHDGLTVRQYDQVLASARRDPTIRERLLQAAHISQGNP